MGEERRGRRGGDGSVVVTIVWERGEVSSSSTHDASNNAGWMKSLPPPRSSCGLLTYARACHCYNSQHFCG